MAKIIGHLSQPATIGQRPGRSKWRVDLLFPAAMVGAVMLAAQTFFGF